MSEEYQTVDELKESGNKAVKEEKYEEAILHYTHAIKRDPTNFALYSNRSYAFLKLQQFYYAFQDAEKTIKLNPTWAKGYFRKGEVEVATEHYAESLRSYMQALQLLPTDLNILKAFEFANKKLVKQKKDDDQIPWLGGGIGIVLGVIIIFFDYYVSEQPLRPLLMVITIIVIALIIFALAKAYRYYLKCRKESLLMPPPNLIDFDEKPEEEKQEASPKQNVRYTKSQARQRYKKGKM